MSEEHCAVVRRFFDEVWNARRTELIEELITDESVCYAEDGPLRGPGEFRARQYEPLAAAFPDLQVELEGLVCEGDVVVVRWRAEGNHRGDGLGFAPTNEPATFHGISWIRVQDGKMKEGWQYSNIPGVLQGLAAIAGG